MTRDELTKNYWQYYLMLESKFINTKNFVEICADNFPTFSNEYALLLQGVGAELDHFFKAYCGFNATDRKSISDYALFILNDFPSIINQKVKVIGTDLELIPFQGWNASQAAQSLSWWQAFDNIKHNRLGNFVDAKQENVLNMLAALYLVEMKQFGKVAKIVNGKIVEPDAPEHASSLFMLMNWKYQFIRHNVWVKMQGNALTLH
ncbi:MAG: hypothetical protein IKZ43_08340 [Acidaminococcaceae bacterium]|nr:hypothetical protein [Acidaminococcaceae bacterium]